MKARVKNKRDKTKKEMEAKLTINFKRLENKIKE